jgi:hypothetical protein
MTRLQPGSTISYILTAVFICGFCLLYHPGTAWTITPDERAATLRTEIRDSGLKWQGYQQQKDDLCKKFGDAYSQLTRLQDQEAAKSGEKQKELIGIEKTLKDAAKSPTGKDKGK